MKTKTFSVGWKRSTQPRKQRKYNYQAPLHLKQKMMHAHLSKELRAKYGTRNTQLKTGDKVKVMRGQFAKKEGKVEKIFLKRGEVYITGIEIIKKDGSKTLIALKASQLLITELSLSDKLRKEKMESHKKTEKVQQQAKKSAKVEAKK